MRNFWLLVTFSLVAAELSAQGIPLINSGEMVEKAGVLRDSGKYDLAIKTLLAVPARDTNYVWAQAELAEVYNLNKQYDEAIATTDRFLKKPGRFRSTLIASKANALEGKKEYDQAIALLQSALKEYPFHSQLRYQLATSFHNKLDYANAVKAYYDVLEISPYYSNAHLNLGVIALWTGQKTHALMSYGIYLAINNKDNSKLVTLENLCSNQSQNEGASKEKAGPNAFEKLDQIIRSKIAMDKKFKTVVPVDVAIVKQFEMMEKQLNTVSQDTDDPWVKFYLPVYQTMHDQKLTEAFLYHILTSSGIEAVKKWNAKNEKALGAFFNAVNAALTRDRGTVRAPESLGVGARTSAQYTKQNALSGVGGLSDGKEHGRWVYFHSNGERAADGVFDNGVKKGVWNYYSRDGVISSTEDETTGEITKFYPGGGKEYTYFLKEGKIDGEFVFFYPCGAVSERRTHKADKRVGKGEAFHATGVKSVDFEYDADGKLASWIEYDVLGKMKSKSTLKGGQRDGIFESYWTNGRLKERESYSAGKRNGPAEGYFDNGKLWYKGSYVNDLLTGEWLYYNRYGEPTEKRFYGEDGKPDQDQLGYHNGTLYYKTTFNKGITTGITYYDKAGKEIWKGGSPDGNFEAKHFYAYGQLLSEGRYKKGLRDGEWKQYFLTGAIQSKYNYVDGQLDGEQYDYYINGKDKIISGYKAGEQHGYYREFHINGKVSKEGWYVDGLAEQQWKLYYADGSLEEDLYYLKSNLVDTVYLYSIEGDIAGRNYFDNGTLKSETASNPLQEVYSFDAVKTRKYDIRFSNGQPLTRYEINCGLLTGSFERFYPDGGTMNKFSYVGGLLHGDYKGFDHGGREQQTGSYSAGEPTGLWVYRNDVGNQYQSFRYADGKIDSVLTAYYESGPLYFTAQYRNGDRNGLMRLYGPNGSPLVEKLYESGYVVSIRTAKKGGDFGEWMPMRQSIDVVAYYPDGTRGYEEKYENGLLTGAKRVWYPDGKICKEYNQVDGDYEGPYAEYYPNGKILIKGQYHLDELDGKIEIFKEDGSQVMVSEYKLGHRSGTTTIYSNGVKVKEIVYYNGAPMK
jgi:antitoxin component YwqK of YwqJK toxin-antitoxin module